MSILELQRENREHVAAYVAAWTEYLEYRYKTAREDYIFASENALYEAFRAAFKAHWPVRNELTAAIDVAARELGLRYPKDKNEARVLALTRGHDPVVLCCDPAGYWAGDDRPTGYTVASFEDWRY